MNILFVTSSRIGDAVLSTGLLAHLGGLPGARITVACGPLPAPLFAHAPGVERVIAISKRRHSRHWFDLWRQVVGQRWDLVVDLRSSALAWTLLAGRRRIFRATTAPVHKVVQLSRCLDLAQPAAPRLWPSPPAPSAAQALLGEGPIIALAPTANWAPKQWLPDRFAAVIAHLTAPGGRFDGAKILVLGAPGEREAAAPVLAALPAERTIDMVGRLDLDGTAGCLAECDFFLGNDSGLMHMAAASGIPTVGLFGPSNPAWYAPWGPHTAWIAAPEPWDALIARARSEGQRDSVMDGLTVAEVCAAADRLLDAQRGS